MVSLDKLNDKEGGFFGNIPSSPHPQSKLFVFEEDWAQKVNTETGVHSKINHYVEVWV